MLFAGALAAAAALTLAGLGAGTEELSVGESATGRGGPRVAVFGWGPTDDPDHAGKLEVSVRSCRVSPGGVLLDAGAFSVQLTDGRSISPQGSTFDRGPDGDCVRGVIFFPVPEGAAPASVGFDRGRSSFRWRR